MPFRGRNRDGQRRAVFAKGKLTFRRIRLKPIRLKTSEELEATAKKLTFPKIRHLVGEAEKSGASISLKDLEDAGTELRRTLKEEREEQEERIRRAIDLERHQLRSRRLVLSEKRKLLKLKSDIAKGEEIEEVKRGIAQLEKEENVLRNAEAALALKLEKMVLKKW